MSIGTYNHYIKDLLKFSLVVLKTQHRHSAEVSCFYLRGIKMKQTILEKQLSTTLNDDARKNINLYLKKMALKYKDKVNIHYQWNKSGNKLSAVIDKVFWQASFNKKKVKVTLDAPFYLMPFISNYKEDILYHLEKSIEKLIL